MMKGIEWGPRPNAREVISSLVSGAITGIMVLLFLIGTIAALVTMVVVVQGYMIPGVCAP